MIRTTSASTRDVLCFTLGHWRRRPGALSVQVLLLLAATSCETAAPWATSHLLGVVARPVRDVAAAWVALAAIVVLFLLHIVLRSGVLMTHNDLTTDHMKTISDDTLRHVLDFSASWHSENFAGATVRSVSRAMQAYSMISDAVFITLGPSILVFSGITISIGCKWPLAGLFMAVAIMAYISVNFYVTARWLRPANLSANALDADVNAAFGDAVSGVATIRNFAAERREQHRFSSLTSQWRLVVVRAWNRSTWLSAIQNGVLIALQAGLLGILTWGWSVGRASAGDVAFGVTSFLLIAGHLRSLPDVVRLFRRGLDELTQAVSFAQMSAAIQHSKTKQVYIDRPFSGAIGVSFENVDFKFNDTERMLFNGLSFTVAPGERVAIIGFTGVGKSTLASLLTRVHQVQGGRVSIGGHDVMHMDLEILRRAVAIVPQEPALFHRSVRENIAYARPDAALQAIETAARQACAHEFIMQLPNGYDTLVGERGCKLSGGERQRIAIARAFLADASILVLDEATSALDVMTERLVTRAAEALMAGRTTLIIAHRLSTIRSADRILVLEGGRIVESGTHDALLVHDGAYARLVQAGDGRRLRLNSRSA